MAQVHLFQSIEIGLPPVVLQQIVVDDFCSEDFAERSVSGVAGIRHQHLFSGIDKGESDMQNTLLASNQWKYLVLGIQLHLVPPLVEVCHCLAQFVGSHRWLVTVGIGVVCHFA